MESHPRSAGRVNADAYVHRRLAGASHKSARPPNVSLLNSLNHPPLSQSQQPPHISSTAQPSSSKTPQLATFNKPRLRSFHRNLPKVSSPCAGLYFYHISLCRNDNWLFMCYADMRLVSHACVFVIQRL